MYGLILEGIGDAVRRSYGDKLWDKIREKCGIESDVFSMHKVYSETMIPRIMKATHELTKKPESEVMEMCGFAFVPYSCQFGYDRVMRVLGRHLRDFLNGLDNLHEYLRFSYPMLKPPSFFCENENKHGLTLHYRSKRKGFVYYVMGQIVQVANTFFNTPVEIEVVKKEEGRDLTHIVLKLHFDNSDYMETSAMAAQRNIENTPVSSQMFLSIFPFHLVFTSDMTIKSVGTGLGALLPGVVGHAVDEIFVITRPMVEFDMDHIMSHQNNVFELMTIEDTSNENQVTEEERRAVDSDEEEEMQTKGKLKTKGQMVYMEDWDAFLFLGSPVLTNLTRINESGLYLNDLSMHDCSRDLVLSSTQQECELKLALDQESSKTKCLDETSALCDSLNKKNVALLGHYLPRHYTNMTWEGESAASMCHKMANVCMLSSQIVGFDALVSKADPGEVAKMLNTLYAKCDSICDKNYVYKVSATGASMLCCAGAPIASKFCPVYICDTALDFQEAAKTIKNPGDGHFALSVGVHMGTVVGAVTGHRFPRYNIYGEDVLTTTALATKSEPGKILVSQAIREQLAEYPFECKVADTMTTKSGEKVRTSWLIGRGDCTSVSLTVEDYANVKGNITGFVDEQLVGPTIDNYQPQFQI